MAKLAVHEAPTSQPDEAVVPLGERVLARLRADILTLRRAPGEALSERMLEAELGASRTPVRQALMALIHEGLVWKELRGYRVAPFDVSELSAIFEYRGIVEDAAVRLACERAATPDVEALRAVVDRGLTNFTPNDWFELGLDFHVRLAGLSGNPMLRDAVADAVNRTQRTRWLLAGSQEMRGVAHREHCAILDHVAGRRPDEASIAVCEHARETHRRIRSALEEARPLMGTRGFVDTGDYGGLPHAVA